ncbi:MAG TPA: hemerythrin domain-containing protein [Jatrophihabitantaceae bacterium]|jgi:hemerythrin-like domain-containing protein
MTENRAPVIGDVDFTMMYVGHDAFIRDLRRMAAAVEAGAITPSVRTGWAMFAHQLHVHHTAEDEALWPPLRAKVEAADEDAVLDQMELEHAALEPLLERIDRALADRDDVGLREPVGALRAGLTAHMRHEEDAALPLVAKHLGPDGWRAFGQHFRTTQGLRGAVGFFPWLLDDTPAPTEAHVLKIVPPPVRLLYRAVWKPRYQRAPRW